jgi:hypothetical protein
MSSGDSADVLASSLLAIDTFSGTLLTLDFNLNNDQKRFGLFWWSAQTEFIYFERLSRNIFLMVALISLIFYLRLSLAVFDFVSLRLRELFFLILWSMALFIHGT